MTALEMQIDVQQKLGRINSRLLHGLQDAEYDWWLNTAVNTFIKRRIRKELNSAGAGNQDTRKRIDDIEELVTEQTLTCFIKEDGCAYVILPHNYLHPLSERVKIAWNCNGLTYTTSAYTSKYVAVKFPLNYEPTGGEYYENLLIKITKNTSTEVTVFDPDVYDAYASGFSDPDDYFNLLNYILYWINENEEGITAYWEEYGEISKPGHLILVHDGADYVLNSAEIGSTTDDIYEGFDAVADNKTIYSLTAQTYVYKYAELRTLDGENLQRKLSHPYMKTTYDSPAGNYRHGIIDIYHDTTFVPVEVKLSYYRKPRIISLAVNTSCDLNPMVHSEICDLAVELIAAYRGNPNLRNIAASGAMNE